MKLTKTQEKVIKDLQAGYILITDCESRYVEVCGEFNSYRTQSRLIFMLIEKGLICQASQSQGYNFILTRNGEAWNDAPRGEKLWEKENPDNFWYCGK